MSPKIVAIGGTINPGSSTEMALRTALDVAESQGAEVKLFGGEYLAALPHYRSKAHSAADGSEMVEAVRAADGIIIAAPGYHGTISGLVKNALDYLEDHCHDNRLSCILKQIRVGLEREQGKLFQIMGRPGHLESPTGEDVPFD